MSKELEKLIKAGESEQLEHFATLAKDKIGKAVCGFLNASGGRVIVGIDAEGHAISVQNAETHKAELDAYLNEKIVPQTPITVSIENYNGQQLILVKVWAGSKPPYMFDGKIYLRKGVKTVLSGPEDISPLIIRRQQADLHWERQIALGVGFEDLDQALIQDLMLRARKKYFDKVNWTDQESFLTQLGLYQNGSLTNAAVVLFGKTPCRFLPQCRVRIVVMPKGKTGSRYSNDVILEGNLFSNFLTIQEFFRTNIEMESHFSPTEWQRDDRRKYPLEALDEGVLNALIHRDYASISGSLFIGIYGDHLEIMNFGGLPDGWTTNDLKVNHMSLPRNPDIAHACFLQGWIEKLGRGTLMILEKCKENGLKKPQWSLGGGATTLTFYAKTEPEPARTSFNELNNRQHHILELLGEGGPKTVAELLQSLENTVSDRTLRTDLQLLIRGHWVSKLGSGRNTRYIHNRKSSI